MKAGLILWALLAVLGIALAIFAADPVSSALGILLGLVGVVGFLLTMRRQDK
ncbi:hypothetical protein [Arthrobacter sp. ISL-65]|uniref:hypothetical protein n=1 Tax=Arthrobacter sp. ISL-65 TaxID=2819112 RepID=UPI001BEBF5DF|nr:hypothetical protein [Arthrobacter sp. ISL-65]MBT2548980.1 hypothetical protein [Arthrobacter sp. ISL-65]